MTSIIGKEQDKVTSNIKITYEDLIDMKTSLDIRKDSREDQGYKSCQIVDTKNSGDSNV